jgi:hypothetical protein
MLLTAAASLLLAGRFHRRATLDPPGHGVGELFFA